MGGMPRGVSGRWAGSLLHLLLVLCLAGCASLPRSPLEPAPPSPSGELAAILDAKVLVIATDPAAPPHSRLLKDQERLSDTRCAATQYTSNQFTGFDVEVGNEIARRLGVEPCYVIPTWGQVVAGNWGDLWDITVQSVVITRERMHGLYFTQPYISGEMFAFVHADNQVVQQPADLSGMKIGVCAGCANELYLRGQLDIPGETIASPIESPIRDPQIFGYDTDLSALEDLAAGDGLRLDGVISDPDTGSVVIQSGLPIRQLPQVLYRDFSAIAVDKNSTRDPVPLVLRLNEIIQQMHADQTLSTLSKKYYNGDTTALAARFDVQALRQFP